MTSERCSTDAEGWSEDCGQMCDSTRQGFQIRMVISYHIMSHETQLYYIHKS